MFISVCGASRMPATAASIVPIIQAYPDSRAAEAPLSEASCGSSTTARIATPGRVRVKKTRSTTATSTATPTVISCSALTVTWPIVTWSFGKKFGSVRLVVWAHSVLAKP